MPVATGEPFDVDGVVICAGLASRDLAAKLGDRLNIYPVEGCSITVQLHTPESRDAAPQVIILNDATKIVTSNLGRDRFRVAGTAEFNRFNRDIRHERIGPLVRWTRETPAQRPGAWAAVATPRDLLPAKRRPAAG